MRGKIKIAVILVIAAAATGGQRVSASGSGYLEMVPVGGESVYVTDIRGINQSSSPKIFSFQIIPEKGVAGYEPLDPEWVRPAFDTAVAPPGGKTRPLELITSFPADSLYYNRRYAASVLVGVPSRESLAMAVAARLLVEMEPSRDIYSGTYELMVAPSAASLAEKWDSIFVYNGSIYTDTVEIYWTDHPTKDRKINRGIEIMQKRFLWKVPSSIIMLQPGKGVWVFYRKKDEYNGRAGFIVCKGNSKSVYCSLMLE